GAGMAAIAAVPIRATQSTWAGQHELTRDHAQARQAVEAAVQYARAVLSADARLSTVDHLGEPWALRTAPAPVGSGQVGGYIEDQQGAFNLNNLVVGGKVSAEQLGCFRRLLGILGLSPTLADAVAD